MVRQWRGTVKSLLTDLHGHLVSALASVSLAMTLAGHCHSGRVASCMAGSAAVASRRRRLERLLANERLDAAEAMQGLAGSVLSAWSNTPGRRVVLILDETPRAQVLRCMKVSVGYRKRALPLAYEVYKPRRRGIDKLVLRLLRQVARVLPPGLEVTLLADRGLCWPCLIDLCSKLGWHYVLRLQGQTRVLVADRQGVEHESSAKELAPRKGAKRLASVKVFKKAGWRKADVTAVWERRCREPWLLVSDLPASYARCAGYAKRSWCEQMHRDEKSSGLGWGQSRVDDPKHAGRLLLAMALAMLLAVSVGSRLLKDGLRRELDGRRRRLHSIFQMGVRWIRKCLVDASAIPNGLYLYPA